MAFAKVSVRFARRCESIFTERHFSYFQNFSSRVEIQHRIGNLLGAYDDLIENNRRRIQLLEQSARLLYKEWFVHLRFPGYERVKVKDGVPEGWKRHPVGGDCATEVRAKR